MGLIARHRPTGRGMRRAIGHFLMWWPAVLGACFLWVVPPWGVLLAVIVVGSIVVGYHLAPRE